MATDREQLVLDMIRAVEDRDGERLLEIYDPDVEFVWPPELPYGGTYRRDEVVEMSEAYLLPGDLSNAVTRRDASTRVCWAPLRRYSRPVPPAGRGRQRSHL